MNINIDILENKLKNIGIPGKYIKSVENYFYDDIYILFDNNITINKIKARQNDINFILNNSCDIVSSYPYIILRTIKNNRDIVYLSSFQNDIISNNNPCIAIGKTENGSNLIYNLDRLPHLLVAGATGSGKSVFLNSCILSLIMNCKCELVLIDPKKVEFSFYSGLSCLKYPIINTPENAVKVLKNLVDIMNTRYKIFDNYKVRNIKEYNSLDNKNMYDIAIFIDEFSDLTMNKPHGKIIKEYIILLAQKARATGIHLILATQRPDSKTVDGLIKANFPSVVCFSVSNKINSRIILDNSDGEKLIGNGDGIFKTPNFYTRFQACYISTENIIKFVDSYKSIQ